MTVNAEHHDDRDAIGPSPPPPVASGAWRALAISAGVVGLVAAVCVLIAIRSLQWNIVTYVVQTVAPATYLVPTVFTGGLLVLLLVGAIVASRQGGSNFADGLGLLWPMIGAVPLAIAATAGATVPFYFALLMILGVAWSAGRVGSQLVGHAGDSGQLGNTAQAEACGSDGSDGLESAAQAEACGSDGSDGLQSAAQAEACGSGIPSVGGLEDRPKTAWVYAVIALLIVVLTILHTRLQINFFDHFMLGHADFGHFTEELKNALAGRGLRSDSFPNTRLGWHFVPLLYVLVPGYALWPSPVYLMAVGALVVHLPALPIVAAAVRRSGSALVGLLFGLAWLLLPSTSRLIYSNTYGFQWIYIAMPLIAVMIAAGLAGKWRLSVAMAIVVLLCKETAAAATLGWGLYMLLFTPRRKSGAALAVGSIVYALICIYLIIPHFAASGVYERTSLFGELGANLPALIGSIFTRPGDVLARLVRPEAIYFLLLLLVPMALLPLRGWRVLVAAAPTLVLILLLDNPDWLSIKFWHHATVLPFVFFAAIASLPVKRAGQSTSGGGRRACSRGIAWALVFAAGWSHYFFGFSPLAKPYEVYAESAALHQQDPRLATVHRLRATFPRTDTILATERLAAHFTDYKRVYTGSRIMPADVVIIDRADHWDTTDLPNRAADYAADPDYDLYGEFGSIVVFVRHKK